MGYSIMVEPNRLREMAKAISNYRYHHGSSMHELSQTVIALKQEEIGSEFDLFLQRWAAIQGQDSTSAKMLSCLLKYENYLNYAAELYETIQNNSLIRANRV